MYRENCKKSILATYDFQYDDNKNDDVSTYDTTMAPNFHNIRTMIWEIKHGKPIVK